MYKFGKRIVYPLRKDIVYYLIKMHLKFTRTVSQSTTSTRIIITKVQQLVVTFIPQELPKYLRRQHTNQLVNKPLLAPQSRLLPDQKVKGRLWHDATGLSPEFGLKHNVMHTAHFLNSCHSWSLDWDDLHIYTIHISITVSAGIRWMVMHRQLFKKTTRWFNFVCLLTNCCSCWNIRHKISDRLRLFDYEKVTNKRVYFINVYAFASIVLLSWYSL